MSSLSPKEIRMLRLKGWATLDKQQQEISKQIDCIYNIMPYGQAPPEFHKKYTALVNVQEKKAGIWNKIRNYIIPNGRDTLWQAAIKADEKAAEDERTCTYFVKWSGVEYGVSFTAQDIERLYCGEVV